MTDTIPAEVGPVFDAGLSSPTHGDMGLLLKPGTFKRDVQEQLRDDVVAALSQSIADRDIRFWKRSSQHDWSGGDGQDYFSDQTRYDSAVGLDVHTPGLLRLVPQPTLLRSSLASALNGRGAVVAQRRAFFPWTDGNYAWADAATGGVVSTSTTPAGGQIADIVSDGTTVFFALGNASNVWQTPAAAPVALAAYDAGTIYGRLVYDQLAKVLYASPGAVTGLAKLYKINAGGAPTVVYDFLTGRVDALEMFDGDVIVGWNDGGLVIPGVSGSLNKARLFSYNGSQVSAFVDFPDGAMIVGLKAAAGVLYVEVDEADPLDRSNFPAEVHATYAVTGSTVTRLGPVDGLSVAGGTGSLYPIGSPTMAVQVGQFVFFPGTGHVTQYDTVIGAFSRSLGDSGLPALSNTFTQATMSSLAFLSGIGLLCEYGGGATTGGIYNLHGSTAGITPSFPAAGTCQLTGSRMDGGLPYVSKFWYAIDCNLSADLATGESVQMDYSLDDGVTWTACANSPFTTSGENAIAFLVKQVNPHARYRVRPVSNPNVSAGPLITAVSMRYAVVNADASVYRFTVQSNKEMRARNNEVLEPGYGKAMLDYLQAIGMTNELVTFYEPNDSTRTPHTCWVVSVSQATVNTGGTYDPRIAEGDVAVVLWEVPS